MRVTGVLDGLRTDVLFR